MVNGYMAFLLCFWPPGKCKQISVFFLVLFCPPPITEVNMCLFILLHMFTRFYLSFVTQQSAYSVFFSFFSVNSCLLLVKMRLIRDYTRTVNLRQTAELGDNSLRICHCR